MEIQYENRYTANKKMFLSFAKGASFTQRFFHIFAVIGIVICALALLYLLIFLPGKWETAFSPAVSLILCVMLLFFPQLTAQVLYKNALRVHDGVIPETKVEFGDQITMAEGTLSVSFKYSQVTKLRQTDHLYFLMLGKENAIMLSKDDFTIGDAAGFQAFIWERCPNLQKNH